MKIITKPVFALLLCFSGAVQAAGGVVGEPGSCIIEVGLYTAHFTIYQPGESGNQEFCEDLPAAANTLFVMDYLHGSMKEVGVDFRIIRDLEDWGIFARWENIQEIEDLDQRTVFYQPPSVRPDNKLQVEHLFDDPGAYIGIVTAPHPSKDILYHAVFPFEVGRTPTWYWLLPLCLLVLGAWFFMRRQKA